ncbi:sodium/nucleoside cotransporter 2 isoform X4 [Eschrichtius robustus]|uniref:sodium/nucleoside cotransporter 2 isoform X4 n=1 Tax=Eschrichtius robustus TaxID=9764 RepID=UPI0035C17B71
MLGSVPITIPGLDPRTGNFLRPSAWGYSGEQDKEPVLDEIMVYWETREQEMEKTNGREGIALSTVETGIENPGLELMEEGINPEGTRKTEEQGHSFGDGLEPPTQQRYRRNLQPFTRARSFCKTHAGLFKKILLSLLCLAYAAYFLAACILNFHRALALFVLTCLVLLVLVHRFLKRFFGEKLTRCLKPLENSCLKLWMKCVFTGVFLVGLILWLVLDTAQRPEQLISFTGICMFTLILFACSKHHSAVSWRTVLWGLGLQFVFGILVIRTDPGFNAFQWLGNQIQIFLNYTVAGSSFVFGDMLVKDIFAFQALPIILFFGCVMSILYYLGFVQWVVQKIAWFLQITMGTTATETLAVAGNIFVGMTEAPLLIRPYLADMTLSEVHAVMTGGFATISGTVLGAFISFGVICSYILRPVVFMMGVEWADCPMVAEMVGIKFFTNEFVAYQQLSQYKNKRLSGVEEWIGGEKQWISVRAEIITTFSLCGFANLSSIGITLGGLTSMVPHRKSDLSKVVVSALFTGACVSLISACVAGILYVPRGAETDCVSFLNTSFTNRTYEIYVCCRELFRSTSLNGTNPPSFPGPWEDKENLLVWASLVAQWLRICLPMQGTRV